MTDLLGAVRDLKTRAKNRRDDGLFEEGVGVVNEAIELLDGEFGSATSDAWRTRLASELADCHGLIGGLQRRWGLASDAADERADHLRASVAAYEKGDAEYEREEKFGVVNSYNLVNRLVSRLLLEPAVDLSAEMTEAKGIVEGQLLQKRRGDVWALADQALLRLLLGEADHTSAWAPFRDKSPPDFAYESVLDTLELLAQVALAVKSELESSIALLEEDLENL